MNMKKQLLIAAMLAVMALTVNAQYFGGTSPRAFNAIPNNEGTVIIIPLCTTNIVTNATTRTVTMSGMELPGGRDLGLLFKGTIITNNAQFTVNYQLSPDNVNWTWPYSTLSSGVIASNTVATYAAQLTLSNSVTYPFRYWKIYSITAGTNSLYVSNAVAVYKTDPKLNYSR